MTAEAPAPRRRRPLRILLVALLALSAVMLVRAVVRGSWTSPERTGPEGLSPGGVETRLLDREGRTWVSIASLVDAPIAKVWKVVHDHERMTEFMPRMARLRVLEPGEARRKVRIDFGFLGIDRFTEIEVTRTETPERREERWERTGGTLPVNHGRWLLLPAPGGGTYARYEVDAETGLPAPGWLERAILRDALPVVLRRVGERVRELERTEPSYFEGAR